MPDDIGDVEGFRKSYELPHVWNLRKEFLLMHNGKIEEDRLVCLSNVFVNVECMGLKYSQEVMDTVKEMGSKVPGLEVYRHNLEMKEPELPHRESRQLEQPQRNAYRHPQERHRQQNFQQNSNHFQHSHHQFQQNRHQQHRQQQQRVPYQQQTWQQQNQQHQHQSYQQQQQQQHQPSRPFYQQRRQQGQQGQQQPQQNQRYSGRR